MRDTWIGSGFYSIVMTREFTCLDCGWSGEAEGTTDDSKFSLYAECQNCKAEMVYDLDAEREHNKYFGDN
jgi:transcription elongation factor Elf1